MTLDAERQCCMLHVPALTALKLELGVRCCLGCIVDLSVVWCSGGTFDSDPISSQDVIRANRHSLPAHPEYAKW